MPGINRATSKTGSASLAERISPSECSLSEFCDLFKICRATAHNWVKKGRISSLPGSRPIRFKRSDVMKLLQAVEAGRDKSLTSRRNKQHKKGVRIPRGYLSHSLYGRSVKQLLAAFHGVAIEGETRRVLLAEFGLRLLARQGLVTGALPFRSLVDTYHEGLMDLGTIKPLIDDLLGTLSTSRLTEDLASRLSKLTVPDRGDEDFLGFLNMLFLCIGHRKANGVYYTPHDVVNATLKTLLSCDAEALTGDVLDPCCGTGQFIMEAMKIKRANGELFERGGVFYYGCHGFDVDPISIQLTRLNMVLVTGEIHLDALYSQFVVQDTLATGRAKPFKCILGNPPWGYAYTGQETLELTERYALAKGARIESYGVFIEWAKEHLVEGGWLSYVLPEAILTVKVHKRLRHFINQYFDIGGIDFFENAFDGVFMPSVGLHLQIKGLRISRTAVQVSQMGLRYPISTKRLENQDAWILRPTDQAFDLALSMASKTALRLRGNSIFALGIVTGDNKAALYRNKAKSRVPVLIGTDISAYRVSSPRLYVDETRPFQQIAPREHYSAPEKLVYRFIADRPIVARDIGGHLTLNSCNCLIPRLNDYSAKTVMALLNAAPLQFYYKTLFPSMKVLRAHLEELPIPHLSKSQMHELENTCDALQRTFVEVERLALTKKIDAVVSQAFGLSEEDILLMKACLHPNDSLI